MLQSLTRSFVALDAITSGSRQPPKAGVGVVARKNVFARLRGSPEPGLDRKLFQRDGPTRAERMVQLVLTYRQQRRLPEVATVARSLASIAGGLVRITRLSRAFKTRAAGGAPMGDHHACGPECQRHVHEERPSTGSGNHHSRRSRGDPKPSDEKVATMDSGEFEHA